MGKLDLQMDEALCSTDWIEQISLNVRHVRLMPGYENGYTSKVLLLMLGNFREYVGGITMTLDLLHGVLGTTTMYVMDRRWYYLGDGKTTEDELVSRYG